MADSAFKIPSLVPQDLALIMGLVDTSQAEVQRDAGARGTSSVPASREVEGDIESSGTESEDEVEAEITLPRSSAGIAVDEPDGSDGSSSDSGSSSLSRDSPSSSTRRARNKGSKRPGAIDLDLDEECPPPPAYVPSAHELPPSAVVVPPLPDPSTLPPDPLELIGEITTVLHDSVVVRGGGPSGTGYLTPQARRDAALDEGSLLLFQDRTMLGYVWETFGPTALPHYVVRINPAASSSAKKTHVSSTSQEESSEPPNTLLASGNSDALPSTASLPVSPSLDGPDPARLKVSTLVYHIPSLSRFVFPGALARLKGSDASNVHDEEPAEHELEFSDDEAEAAHKRLRNRSYSHALSSAPYAETDSTSAIGDDASSLYGESPYDFEISPPSASALDISVSPGGPADIPASLADPAVRDALMLARKSRNRRPSATASMSEASYAAGPSHLREDNAPSRNPGRGRGRGRGGANRPLTDPAARDRRGRGRGRGQAAPPPQHTHRHDPGPYFSFEEYDPHMPRPPSPTSLAIARATGQWADGTPFPYQTDVPALQQQQQQQPQQPQPQLQPPSSPSFAGQFQSRGFYDPTFEQQHAEAAAPYPVVPHINPRFAQALGFAGVGQMSLPVQSPVFPQQSVYHFRPPGAPSEEGDDAVEEYK